MMDGYTKSITVSIKWGSLSGLNTSNSKVITKTINIPIVRPGPVPNQQPPDPSLSQTRTDLLDSAPSLIPLFPRTTANDGEDYKIERTSSATILYLIEDMKSELNVLSLKHRVDTPEDLCEPSDLWYEANSTTEH